MRFRYDACRSNIGTVISDNYICYHAIPCSLKYLRVKYFVVLPNSAQKQIFVDKIFVVQLPATPCIRYELEISWEKHFAAIL